MFFSITGYTYMYTHMYTYIILMKLVGGLCIFVCIWLILYNENHVFVKLPQWANFVKLEWDFQIIYNVCCFLFYILVSLKTGIIYYYDSTWRLVHFSFNGELLIWFFFLLLKMGLWLRLNWFSNWSWQANLPLVVTLFPSQRLYLRICRWDN